MNNNFIVDYCSSPQHLWKALSLLQPVLTILGQNSSVLESLCRSKWILYSGEELRWNSHELLAAPFLRAISSYWRASFVFVAFWFFKPFFVGPTVRSIPGKIAYPVSWLADCFVLVHFLCCAVTVLLSGVVPGGSCSYQVTLSFVMDIHFCVTLDF